MAKLFKWLMVMLIPLFSLTFTSCGGDDDDEPKQKDTPSLQFLIGRWELSNQNVAHGVLYSEKITFEFQEDMSFKATYMEWTGGDQSDNPYDKFKEFIGTYSYSNGNLVLNGKIYNNASSG